MKCYNLVHLALLAVLIASAGHVQAAVIWFNGDPDLVNGLSNELNSSISDSKVYDDFNVTSAVTVTDLFSNNFMSFFTSSAAWEIRSSVSVGNGGTLIAFGTGAATQTQNGFNAFGHTGYRIRVSGLSITLSPGTYWLAVTPIGTGIGRSYVSSTSGANAFGTPPGNNKNAFFYSTYYNANFDPTSNEGQPYDFSMGVVTASTSAVPEPSSLAIFGVGAYVAGIGAVRRRRREKQQETTA